MRRLLALAVLLLAAAPLYAQPSGPGVFSFLRLEPSARGAALGGSFGAVHGDDPAALFYNPALLSEETSGTLSLSYLNHLADLNAGFLSYGHTVRGVTAAAGIRYLGWGDIPEADENGLQTGTFGASNVALTLGAAHAYGERIRYGASLHAVMGTVADYRASALAADAGVLYRIPEAAFSVSASVHNVGLTLSSLGQTRDALPLDVRVSVSKRLRHLPLLLTATGYNLHAPGEGPPSRTAAEQVLAHLALGGELQFSPSFNLRAGFNPRRNQELRTKSRLDAAGLGLGFGLRISRVKVDYAYNSWSENGGLHLLSLRTRL